MRVLLKKIFTLFLTTSLIWGQVGFGQESLSIHATDLAAQKVIRQQLQQQHVINSKEQILRIIDLATDQELAGHIKDDLQAIPDDYHFSLIIQLKGETLHVGDFEIDLATRVLSLGSKKFQLNKELNYHQIKEFFFNEVTTSASLDFFSFIIPKADAGLDQRQEEGVVAMALGVAVVFAAAITAGPLAVILGGAAVFWGGVWAIFSNPDENCHQSRREIRANVQQLYSVCRNDLTNFLNGAQPREAFETYQTLQQSQSLLQEFEAPREGVFQRVRGFFTQNSSASQEVNCQQEVRQMFSWRSLRSRQYCISEAQAADLCARSEKVSQCFHDFMTTEPKTIHSQNRDQDITSPLLLPTANPVGAESR